MRGKFFVVVLLSSLLGTVGCAGGVTSSPTGPTPLPPVTNVPPPDAVVNTVQLNNAAVLRWWASAQTPRPN